MARRSQSQRSSCGGYAGCVELAAFRCAGVWVALASGNAAISPLRCAPVEMTGFWDAPAEATESELARRVLYVNATAKITAEVASAARPHCIDGVKRNQAERAGVRCSMAWRMRLSMPSEGCV